MKLATKRHVLNACLVLGSHSVIYYDDGVPNRQLQGKQSMLFEAKL